MTVPNSPYVPANAISPIVGGPVPDITYSGTSPVVTPLSAYLILHRSLLGHPCANVDGSCDCDCCGGGGGGAWTVVERWHCECWRNDYPWRKAPHGCACVVKEKTRAATPSEIAFYSQYAGRDVHIATGGGGRVTVNDGVIVIDYNLDPREAANG